MSHNKNAPGILGIFNPDFPPQINKIKKRCLMLSPTVNAGLERECKMTDFIKDPRELGKGGFGSVWKVIHKKTQKIYCIKIIKKQGIIEQKLEEQMNREIEIMYLLNHPHCLRLKNHFEDDENFYLIMPLATKGQLYKILRKAQKFDERTTAQILRETISALQYLHSFNPPIIHRDIKPENLLLNENGRVLLADYGWSNFKKDEDVRKTFCGTPEYIAPEMLRKEAHDHRIDIWSVGVLMFELLAGYSPFSAKSNNDLYYNIKKLRIHWPNDFPPIAKNLVLSILKLNPKERPSLEEILNHKWFQQTKIIKPLLENTLHTEKDLFVYHLMGSFNEEINKKLNVILKISETNENAQMIKNEDKKKINIIKQIENKKKNNINNNNNIISTINVNKEQIETLKLQNVNLKNDLMNLKNKNKTLENENKLLKNENKKLKEENSSNLLIKIKDYKNEIEKYKILNNERINLITEIEEKNKNISDLNLKIEKILFNQNEKEKEFNNLKNKINELNKQIDLKDINIDNLNQKNNELLLDKQTIFNEYQKKIEEFQNKFLEEENNNEDNFSKIIEIVTQNLNELQNVCNKKIDNLNLSYEQFRKEYLQRDENIISLLNEKYKFLKNDINNFSNILINKIEKISDSNKDEKNINSKLEWYSKQIADLSVFKGKALEYEQKIVSLNKNIQFLNEKINIAEQSKNAYEKMYKLMVEEFKNNQQYQLNIEAKMSEMKDFLFQNLPSEKVEEFNEILNKK